MATQEWLKAVTCYIYYENIFETAQSSENLNEIIFAFCQTFENTKKISKIKLYLI